MEKEGRRTKDAEPFKTPGNGSIVSRERRAIGISVSKTDLYTNWVVLEVVLQIDSGDSLPDISRWIVLWAILPLGPGVAT
jgi:hypothetical protein